MTKNRQICTRLQSLTVTSKHIFMVLAKKKTKKKGSFFDYTVHKQQHPYQFKSLSLCGNRMKSTANKPYTNFIMRPTNYFLSVILYELLLK